MKICSKDGCDKKHYGKGFCRNHYRQEEHRKKNPPRKTSLEILNEAFNSNTHDCILWTGATNGKYGHFRENNKNVYVHRYILIKKCGEPTDSSLQTAHECGNSLCINPRHLSWKTPTQNNHDKVRHGTLLKNEAHPLVKISDKEVEKIKSLKGSLSYKSIAEKFDISPSHVERIINGKRRKK